MEDDSSWGYPQCEQDGELVFGLEAQKIVPPIETLLGKYAWAECGADSSHGPDLEKGFELWLEDPKGPAEFPNLQGTISIFDIEGNNGNITGIRKRQAPSEHRPECWEIEIDWPEDDDAMFPCEGCIYVGTVLDDNGYPFVEVQLGDDWPVPYGYGKRQLDDKERVGFSEAEKTRINFLSNAEDQAARDKENAESKARQLEESKHWEEQKKRKKEAQEKNKVSQAQSGNSELPQMSKGARKRANKARRAEEARLAAEEARLDLLKKPAPVSNAVNGTALQVKMEDVEMKPMALIKQEDVKPEPCETPLIPVKQEETVTSISLTNGRGTKREHEDDTNDTSAKRIKLEQ